jgi:UDP-N-acetylmuramate dehydrogenase
MQTILDTTPVISPIVGRFASAYSTYRIGGAMLEAYFPSSIMEAETLLQQLKPRLLEGAEMTVLGWGSNTLIASAGIGGISFITRKLAGIQPLENGTSFRFEAGVHLAKVANVAQQAGLTGGEFFIGIPGTMGGACRMNAGAMGQDSSGVVKRALVFDLINFESGWVSAEAFKFSYRFAKMNPRHQLVLAVDCEFQHGNMAAAQARMETNMAFRKEHHPLEPNGGSVFRNPQEPNAPSVGKMIDELGGRGVWQCGQAKISEKHGNFIINMGQATSLDVLQVMRKMQVAIAENYGYKVYPENKFVGLATVEEQTLWHQLHEGDPHSHDELHHQQHGCPAEKLSH